MSCTALGSSPDEAIDYWVADWSLRQEDVSAHTPDTGQETCRVPAYP